jgi:hypothetical protein
MRLLPHRRLVQVQLVSMARITIVPEFKPTRICKGTPWVRWTAMVVTSAAWAAHESTFQHGSGNVQVICGQEAPGMSPIGVKHAGSFQRAR